jgi:A/G-specific adenine glycosylase
MNIRAVRRSLLVWFSRTKRPLPWRQSKDPYAIWVSEVMLQQTTVAAVIPFYQRFMSRFPNVLSLAAAREDEVLSLWSGLGYYSRARSLRLAARDVVENHQGRFPRTLEGALRLKGIGRYTAAAITSIAFGARQAAVDGNVRRVLSRLHAVRGVNETRLQDLANELLSPRSPGNWNEALMELGATICTPRRPRCEGCPIANHCRGRDRAEHWSEGKPRPKSVPTPMQLALVLKGDKVLLARNSEGGLMGGLYELPNAGLGARHEAHADLERRYRGVLKIDRDKVVARVRHTVTHHRIDGRVFVGTIVARPLPGALSFHSIEDAGALPLSGLTRKALHAAGVFQGSSKVQEST